MEEVKIAMELWLKVAEKEGKEVPSSMRKNYSMHFVEILLRMPSLRRHGIVYFSLTSNPPITVQKILFFTS